MTIATDRSTALAIERILRPSARCAPSGSASPAIASERLAALDRAVDDAFAGIGLDGADPADPVPREHGGRAEFVGITAIEGVPTT